MTRDLRRLVSLGGLVVAAVVALSAVPTGATIVCQPGHTPPPGGGTGPYCKNVKPRAVTRQRHACGGEIGEAERLGGRGRRRRRSDEILLPVRHHDGVRFTDTPTKTLGACQPGVSPPSPYCTTPDIHAGFGEGSRASAVHDVSLQDRREESRRQDQRRRQDLHDEVRGPDRELRSPSKVGRGQRFNVSVTLSAPAKVTIFIARHGSPRERDPNGLARSRQVHDPDHGPE